MGKIDLMALGSTTVPPDEDFEEDSDGKIIPAMFVTVKYGYEKEKVFTTDVPIKMLMARIQKACTFPFPDLPQEFTKYDLKEEGQPAAVGIADTDDMQRARKILNSRAKYIFCGYDEEAQEFELCMPEPEVDADGDGEASS